MIREISLFGIAAMVLSLAMADVSSDNASWVATSNGYTKMLLDVRLKHRPEIGTNQGLSQYDDKVSQPTLEDEDRERQETVAVLAKLKSAVAEQKQKEVSEDLQIMIRDTELRFRIEDFERAHQVPFLNAIQMVFNGVRILLDEQTPNERRPAAVTRIREYAGLQEGYKPSEKSTSLSLGTHCQP